MKRRNGISLVEVLAAVTISTMVLTMLGKALSITMSHHHATQRTVSFHRAMEHACPMFRADAHRAQSCSLDNATLTLVSDQMTVRYLVTAHALQRVQQFQDRQVSDSFEFPKGCQLQLSKDTNESVSLVVSLLDPSFRQIDPAQGTTTTKTIEVRAMVGRDWRFGRPIPKSSLNAALPLIEAKDES